MAEGDGLLNRFRGKTLTGVRIPPSPPKLAIPNTVKAFVSFGGPTGPIAYHLCLQDPAPLGEYSYDGTCRVAASV